MKQPEFRALVREESLKILNSVAKKHCNVGWVFQLTSEKENCYYEITQFSRNTKQLTNLNTGKVLVDNKLLSRIGTEWLPVMPENSNICSAPVKHEHYSFAHPVGSPSSTWQCKGSGSGFKSYIFHNRRAEETIELSWGDWNRYMFIGNSQWS
jgi:hypothetical protein